MYDLKIAEKIQEKRLNSEKIVKESSDQLV